MASVLIWQDQQILREIQVYKASLKIGRSSECEIQLNDRGVSRKHAIISRIDGLYFLEDLGSTGGVFINQEKIQRRQLLNRDKFIIPPFRLEFLADESEKAESTIAVVEIEGVDKEYALGKQTVTALHNISLTVCKSEFMALAGPSGSGKSTLLNLIGCIDTPTSGTIRIGGQDISGKSPDELADLRLNTLGFIFQTFRLLNDESVLSNVLLPARIRGRVGRETRARANEMLAAARQLR